MAKCASAESGRSRSAVLTAVVGERNALRGWIEIEKEEQIVGARGITISGDKVRVALDRFIERLQRLEQRRAHVGRIDIAIDDCLGLEVKLERDPGPESGALRFPLFAAAKVSP